MKVLEIIPNLASGGAERFVVDLSNELIKIKDVQIFVLTFRTNQGCLNFYEKELNEHISIIKFDGDWTAWSKIQQLYFVVRSIKKIKPDIIHCHTYAFLYTAFASLFFHHIKYFYTVHNLAEKDTRKGVGYYLRKFFLKRKISSITISSKCEQSFLNYYKYPSFCMIENGCRRLFKSSKFDETLLEINSYKIDANTIVFINVARKAVQKNQQLLIKSFVNFLKFHPNSVLLIMGHDGDNSLVVKKEVEKATNIIMLGEKDNVTDYLLCSDFFCLSSLWEGLPISLIEAGMAGTYPVCTPAGGVIDVIKDKSWGILSEDFSCNSYTKALNDAINITINRDYLKSLYDSKYSMKRCADNYYSIFKKAYDKKRKS